MIIPKINYHNDDILLDILYIVQAQMNKFSRVLYENDNENFGILAVWSQIFGSPISIIQSPYFSERDE